MKRVFAWTFAALLLCALLCGTAFADPTYIIDEYDLLTEQEEAALNARAAEISDRYQCSVLVLTVYSLNGKSAEAYAEDYFDQNRLGYNGSYDGILLLLAMEDRDYYVTAAGEAERALTGRRLYDMEDAFVPYLRNNDFYGAFSAYLSESDYLLAHRDDPIDDGSYTREHTTEQTVAGGVLAAISGFLGSLIPVGVMKSKNNNVRMSSGAQNYARPGSLQLVRSQDMYLRTTTNRVRIESNSSRGYGGGGSSHFSSGGISHTGGGGKF